jgi:hypothetical protein
LDKKDVDAIRANLNPQSAGLNCITLKIIGRLRRTSAPLTRRAWRIAPTQYRNAPRPGLRRTLILAQPVKGKPQAARSNGDACGARHAARKRKARANQ